MVKKKNSKKNKASLARTRNRGKSGSSANKKLVFEALSLQQMGRYRDALAVFQRILQTSPDHVEANFRAGELYQLCGQTQLALEHLRRAVSADPSYYEALVQYAFLLHVCGELEEAVNVYQRIIAIKPKLAAHHNELGKVWRDLGQFDQAVSSALRALELKPGYAEAFSNLAHAYMGTGKIAEAVTAYRQAIAADPDFARAYYGLAYATRYREHNSDVELMEQQLIRTTEQSEDRMHIAFGLGKVYEDLGRYDDSFASYAEANRIMRDSYQYSIRQQAEWMQLHKSSFDRSFIDSLEGQGLDDDCPIFILGMPRSGTTLIEQILASHSQVFGAGEVDYLKLVAEGAQALTAKPFPHGVGALKPTQWSSLAQVYVDRLRRGAGNGERRVTDKQLYNIHCVGMIRAILPKAKIIHCVRDPMDNCLSIYTHLFTAAYGYASDLQELGEYYCLYQDLMQYWHELMPGDLLKVSYEELVADPDAQIRQLLDFCELPFEEQCLAFHRTQRAVNTPSAVQVRQPIYKQSIQRWRHFEAHLSPLVEIFSNRR